MLANGGLDFFEAGHLPRARFHGLRHCYVSVLIDSGVTNIKRIQTLVGHASAVMTLDVYGRVLERADARVGDVVNTALLGSGGNPVATDPAENEKLASVK